MEQVSRMEQGAYARLEGRNFAFYMTKKRTVIGRNSKLGDVDVNMGSSRFISRRHLEIVLDRNSFYILCRGKNGIFVDDTFQKRENKRMQIPYSCIIRFPSTQIKLAFTSLLEDLGPPQPMRSPALPPKADIPLSSPFVSPMPSPTGTISAINSCPVSPESSYHHRVPSFDLKAMAKYASKLLSSQEQNESDNESVQEPIHGGNGPEDMSVTIPEATPPEDDDEENPGNKAEGSPQGDDGNSSVKPPYSYAQLIVQALLASNDHRQTLSGIYSFISEKYPYYKMEDKGWKNSIRHNLSLNQYFMKAPREKEGLGFGKGGYWCMHPEYKEKLSSQAYIKRKKKGIPVFPSAGLMSRSAPPSPTHHPMMHSDFSFKDMESKFHMSTPPSTSHFTLPPFFSQLQASSSAHSLPASPSRPSGYTATPLKYFPMAMKASDDLAVLQKSRKSPYKPIPDERDHAPPPVKRVRIDERSIRDGKPDVGRLQEGGIPLSIPTLGTLPTMAGVQPNVQFLSIPMMSSEGMAHQPGQSILTQPLSSFLPQNFFTPANQSSREGTNSHGNEG